MATQLDLDDVVAGNPLAKQELLELRQDIDRLKARLFHAAYAEACYHGANHDDARAFAKSEGKY